MSLTPSLIWSPPSTPTNDDGKTVDAASVTMDMTSTNLHSVIVYSLVSNALVVFPEGNDDD